MPNPRECQACGATTANRLCFACALKDAHHRRAQRYEAETKRLLAEANEWPASMRGDLRTHEGWEEMDTWFTAEGIEPDGTIDGKPLSGQLRWLDGIRDQWRNRHL